MTGEAAPLLRYRRTGGRPPSDDESLEVAADGAWTARRTMGGPRVGRFCGRLTARELARLASDAAGATAAGDAFVPTPRDGATETLAVGAASISLGSNETAPAGWRPLVARARRFLAKRVPKGPVAALELVADAGGASLVHRGSEPLEVEPGSLAIRVVRLAPDGSPLGSWHAPTAGAGTADEPGGAGTVLGQAGTGSGQASVARGWASAGPGWSLTLPFAHGLTPAPGDVLQVRVVLRVRDAGVRTARLVAVVRVS